MTYFYENRATFRNGNQIWSKYFRLFTYWLSFAALVGLYVPVHARSRVVSRKSDGDEFSNPSMTSKRRGDCTQFQARCIKDLDQSCRFCKCNRDNETYRFDLKTCVSSEHLDNYTGKCVCVCVCTKQRNINKLTERVANHPLCAIRHLQLCV